MSIKLANKWIFPISLGILLIVFAPRIISYLSYISIKIYYFTINQPDKFDATTTGQVGDTLGGTTAPFIALFAGYLTFIAFWAQIQANRDVQKQFSIQQFESQFFEMIRLHRENTTEMKISGYTTFNQQTLDSKDGNSVVINHRIEVERIVEGRKVFVSMVKELTSCYHFCELYNNDSSLTKSELFILAYRLFFFGSASNLVNLGFKSEFVELMKIELKKIRDAHKKSVGSKNEFNGLDNKKIELHVKYAPFTGHESRLGHYYRHLFSTVKFVVKKENEGLFDYKQSREYLKILRVQMSNDEQLMLYYNFLSGIGSGWENDDNKYFSHYRMLHNLPIDRIKITENPRVKFSKQILEIKKSTKGKEQMFEWGDK